MLKDTRTTIAGLVAAVVMLAQTFGINIPTEVTEGVVAVAVFFMGLFGKDKTFT